jgi:hypothetical protein
VKLVGALAFLLFACGTAAASEQPSSPNFTCKLSRPATMYDSLKQLPPILATALRAKIGPMADRGEFFNATDVIIKPGPGRRFIRAGQSGGAWFAWYEQGGIAYFQSIVLFTGRDALEVAREYQGAWNDNLCAETDRLLSGRPVR